MYAINNKCIVKPDMGASSSGSRLFTQKVGDCQKTIRSRVHDNHP